MAGYGVRYSAPGGFGASGTPGGYGTSSRRTPFPAFKTVDQLQGRSISSMLGAQRYNPLATLRAAAPNVRSAVIQPDPNQPQDAGNPRVATPPVTPPGTPPAGTPPPGTTPAPGEPSDFDLSGDPQLQGIRALNKSSMRSQIASADEQRKRALTQFGSGDLARQTQFGANLPTYDATAQTGDQNTALAAEQNPFSTMAQLYTGHRDRSRALDQNLSAANLFYGSERGNQLGLEGRFATQQQSDAQGQLQDQLSSIAQMIGAADQTARGNEQQGYGDAWGRAQDRWRRDHPPGTGDKPPGDKPPGGTPPGGTPPGDKPPADKPPGDKPPGGPTDPTAILKGAGALNYPNLLTLLAQAGARKLKNPSTPYYGNPLDYNFGA